MADEPESIAEVEAQAPIETVVETEDTISLETEMEIEGQEGSELVEPVDDDEEVEWNGKKFKAPKGLKEGMLMHADYTRKTQEVAATRKELEDRAERITQQAKASEEEIGARAELHAVSQELDRYKDFGWAEYQALRLNDPLGADEHWNYKAHLAGQHQALTGKVSEAEQRRSSDAQQEIAKRLNETEQYARSKGHTLETDKQVIEFAVSKGVSPKDLQGMMSPIVYEMLHLARLGEQTLKKASAPIKPQAAPIAPLQTVKARATPGANKSLAEMSMDEYVAARKAGRS